VRLGNSRTPCGDQRDGWLLQIHGSVEPAEAKPNEAARSGGIFSWVIAKYPGGTVNRVLQLSDGSYAVHRIATPAPHHIFVGKDFKVTGTA
jgi:hypothetical protein